MKKYFLLFFLILLISSCKSGFEKIAETTNESDIIRVKLRIDGDVTIPVSKDLIIENTVSNEKYNFYKKVLSIKIIKNNNKIFLNDIQIKEPVQIYSSDEKLITINNKKYLGSIKIIPDENDYEILNIVPMETYLISVILSEIPISFDIEAIKAQVIVARTYAKLFMNKYSNRRYFDVDNTTRYQVYKGYNIRLRQKYYKKLEQALAETKGMIIVYDEKPILAYFHSNSGGKIRSGMDYFGNHSDFPYLTTHDDPFSLNYPGSKWEYKMKISDFNTIFDLTHDLSFSDVHYNKEGFVKTINISNTNYSSKEIRKMVGYTKIKSERFKIYFNQNKDTLLISGIGYGHGVGMSQWGAQGMAKEGYNFKEIIDFYYPNTEIKNINNEDRTF